ncbi:glutathione S-transferase C-terminal domain-containing protein [Synechococcus sp. UW69]|uniref:glutathione S-transferase C-terminal domain-containing protein n=1 Tax=Synechococcus sp. UW69 TaxID=368493 RepID=UPI000E0F72AE|nr:glutathione S-transferase C-terminal domain-containing protein [Synechococcus sp. UW69]
MSIPPVVVSAARCGWRWQWQRLMGGLGPADTGGNYTRPSSDPLPPPTLNREELLQRSPTQRPLLVIGRSCPWAHRTWLVHQLRNLQDSVNLLVATADHNAGRWALNPAWEGCDTLLALYRHCGAPPTYRATVPVLVDPKTRTLLGNDSAPLVELLNRWPIKGSVIDLAPPETADRIEAWQALLQPAVNDGVYRCGFARNQAAYDRAEADLFAALDTVEQSLEINGPWLCGTTLSLADVRLFPTLIRWELVYAPLFGCSRRPLWHYPNLWHWRQRLYALPGIADTCDGNAWRQDYFGALFPLNPGGIVPAGPDLSTLVNSTAPSG